MRLAELLQETIDEMNNRNRAAMLSSNPGEIEQMLQNLLALKGFGEPLM
jgi:hypothetical protein